MVVCHIANVNMRVRFPLDALLQHWLNGITLVFQTSVIGSIPLCCTCFSAYGVEALHKILIKFRSWIVTKYADQLPLACYLAKDPVF